MSASGPTILLILENGKRVVLAPDQKAQFDLLIKKQSEEKIDIYLNPEEHFTSTTLSERLEKMRLFDAYAKHLEDNASVLDSTDSDLSISPPGQTFLPSASSAPTVEAKPSKLKRNRSFSLRKGFSIFKTR